MACSILRDTDGRVAQVLDPSGLPSSLYQTILARDPGLTPEAALRNWAVAYTPEFEAYHGPWTTTEPSYEALREFGLPETTDRYNEQPPRPHPAPALAPASGPLDRPLVEAAIAPLLRALPGIEVQWVAPQDLVAADHLVPLDRIQSFVKGSTVYFVEGRVSADTAVEEPLHFFVEALRRDRPALFTGLFNEGRQQAPALWEQIQKNYADDYGFTGDDRRSELVAQHLGQAFQRELAGQPVQPGSLIERFRQWLGRLLDKFFSIGSLFPRNAPPDLARLPATTSFRTLAELLQTGNLSVTVPVLHDPMYSLADEENADPLAEAEPDPMMELKIERIREGLRYLESIIANVPAGPQQETLKRFAENNANLIRHYENNWRTVSVSTLIGAKELMYPEMYKNEANLGTFMHGVIEEVQALILEHPGKSPNIMLTRELFDTLYQKALAKPKTSFEIEGLGADELFEMSRDLMGYLSTFYGSGVIVLPEITLYGKLGKPNPHVDNGVIGRLDFTIIRPDGSVDVVDLKTARVDAGTSPEDKLNAVYANKGDQPFKHGVGAHFARIRDRSKMMNYLAQLTVYEQMLLQMGVKVNSKTVLALFFRTTEGERVRVSAVSRYGKRKRPLTTLHKFKGHELRIFANIDKTESAGRQRDPLTGESRDIFEMVTEAARNELLVTGQQRTVAEPAQTFDPSATAAKDKLLEQLEAVDAERSALILAEFKKQITRARRELEAQIRDAEDLNADPERKEYYENRRRELMTIANHLDRRSGAKVTDAEILYQVINSMMIDFQNIHASVAKLYEKPDLSRTTEEAHEAMLIREFIKLNRQTETMEAMFTDLFELLSAHLDGQNIRNSDILAEITMAISQLQTDRLLYFDIGKRALVRLIRKVNPEMISKDMFSQIDSYLDARLAHLDRDIDKYEKIINGETRFVNKGFLSLRKLAGLLDQEAFTEQARVILANLNAEKARINNFRQAGGVLTEELVTSYVGGLLESPDSAFYIGSSIGRDMMGFSLDDLFASQDSPELTISSISNYLRNVVDEASRKFYNRMEVGKTDETIKEFVADNGGDVEAANERISEITTRYRFKMTVERRPVVDADGNLIDEETVFGTEIEETTHRGFRNPVADEYFRTHDEFVHNARIARERLYEVRRKMGKFGYTDALRAESQQLEAESKDIMRAFVDWRLAHTQTEYVREVYELYFQLPSEIQLEVMVLDERIMALRHGTRGYNNEEQLEETELDNLVALEIERQKLIESAVKDDAALQAYQEKMKNYVTYETNWNMFNRLKAAKQRQYADDPALYEQWIKLNTYEVGTEEYRQELDAVFLQIEDVLKTSTHPDALRLADMVAERNRIIGQYRVNGEVYSVEMEEADRKLYSRMSQKLDALRKKINSKQMRGLDTAGKAKLGELFTQLGVLRRRELRGSYKRAYEQRTQELGMLVDDINGNTVRRKEIELEITIKDSAGGDTTQLNQTLRELDDYLAMQHRDYLRTEREFAKWFNENHSPATPYKLGSMLAGDPIYGIPRDEHYKYVPIAPRHRELKPNRRFNMRAYKPEAMNPDYQQTVEGYPMPLGLTLNAQGHYEMTPAAAQHSDYINPRFASMQQDARAYAFHQKMVMDNFVKRQSKTFGKKLGFLYPAVEPRVADDFAQHGFAKGAWRQAQQMVDKMNLQRSKLLSAENDYGQTGEMRVRFNTNFPVSYDLTTANGISATMLWNLEADINQAMGEANLEITPIIDFLESVSRKIDPGSVRGRQLQRVIDDARFNQRKFIYGQTLDPSQKTSLDHSWFNQRNLGVILGVIAQSRMGFDTAAQLGNLLSGNVQMFLNSHKFRFAGTDDLAWAKMQMYGRGPASFLWRIISDYGKISDVSFETKFMRFVNPLQKDLTEQLDLAGHDMDKQVLRAFNVGDISFGLQDKGETEIAISTALAIFNHARYDTFEMDTLPDGTTRRRLDGQGQPVKRLNPDGSLATVTAYEALFEDSQNGGLSIRPDVDMNEGDLMLLRNRLYKELRDAQGNYSKRSSSRAESFVLGRMILFFRKFMPSVIRTRFNGALSGDVSEMYDWTTGTLNMGWYTGVYHMFKYHGAKNGLTALLPGKLREQFGLSTEVPDFFLVKKDQALREVLAAAAAYYLYQTIRELVMDSDEDDLPWYVVIFLRALVKVTNETRSIVPVPVIGKPMDYLDTFTTFTTAKTEFQTAYNLILHALGMATGDENAYYQRRAGVYEKGDAKILKDLSDLTGWGNINTNAAEQGYHRLKEQVKPKN